MKSSSIVLRKITSMEDSSSFSLFIAYCLAGIRMDEAALWRFELYLIVIASTTSSAADFSTSRTGATGLAGAAAPASASATLCHNDLRRWMIPASHKGMPGTRVGTHNCVSTWAPICVVIVQEMDDLQYEYPTISFMTRRFHGSFQSHVENEK